MKESISFYKCPICGSVLTVVEGEAEHIICCGKPLEKLTANTTDAAVEKHVPIFEKIDDEIVVKVGEIEHPMEKEHYITWVALVSDNRVTLVKLYPEQGTETRFPYVKGANVYAYCNKHGLWKTIVE